MTALITNTDPLLNKLDYSNLSAGDQAEIDALITVSSELVEKYCNRTFSSTAYSEVIDGDNDDFLLLRNIPIVSLTSVVFRSDIDGTSETVDDAEFQYDATLGRLEWAPDSDSGSQYTGCFPRGFQNITVNYTAGYATVPAPIKYAVAQLVLVMYDPSFSVTAIEKEKLGEYFYQRNAEQIGKILCNENKILSLYRKRGVY